MLPAPNDIIGEFYEKYPYPLLSNLSRKHLEKYANQLLACAELTTEKLRGKKILDAGCGTGEIALSMATHAQNVMGIDLSHSSLEHARTLAQKYSLKNIEFIQKNILEMNEKETFDIVTAFGVLHHTQNPIKAFEILSTHVKEKGIFIVGFYHPWGGWKQRAQKFLIGLIAGKNPEKRLKFIERFLGRKLGPHQRAFWADRIANPRERYFRVNEMKKQFEENGFEVIGIQAHKPQYHVANVQNPMQTLTFELFLLAHGYRFVIVAGKRIK